MIKQKKITLIDVILAIYLGLTPIYWFYYTPPIYLAILKYSLVIVFFFLLLKLGLNHKKLKLPKGIYGINGFVILLILMTFGLFQSGVGSLRRIDDLIYGFVFLWGTYVYINIRDDVSFAVTWCVKLLLPFCLLVIASNYIPLLDARNPYVSILSVNDTGFAGLRTGWSIALSLIIPFGMVWSFNNYNNNKIKSFLKLSIVIFCFLGSQLAVGGRTGLLASLSTLFIWFFLVDREKLFVLLLVLSPALFFIEYDWIYGHLRFDRLSDLSSVDDLNDFSANRIFTYIAAIDLILQSPIIGHGFENVTGPLIKGDDIHNLWLRLSVQTGVLAPLFFLIFTLLLLFRSIKNYKLKKQKYKKNTDMYSIDIAAMCSIISGIIISMFEPAALLGTFQTSALWWVAAGTILSRSNSRNV